MIPVIQRVPECRSTSAVLAAMPDAPHGTVVVTDRQTAGRGQRGNSWEAQPGANLTFSLLLRPQAIPAAGQFELSMIVALEVAACVRRALAGAPDAPRVCVKWPNDIYVGDRKIAGILIENSLSGSGIERSIAGIGLNVNQRRFLSDAPNPTSIIHYTGTPTSLAPLLESLCTSILTALERYETAIAASAPREASAAPGDSHSGARETLLARYRAELWRGQGEHPFHEPGGTTFRASIASIAPDGTLTLSTGKTYAFKEIVFEL